MTFVNATQFSIQYHDSCLLSGTIAEKPTVISSFNHSAIFASSQGESVSGALLFYIDVPGLDNFPVTIAFFNPPTGPCAVQAEFTDNLKSILERVSKRGTLDQPCVSYADLGEQKTEWGTDVSVKLQMQCSSGCEAKVTLTQFDHDMATCIRMNEQCVSYDITAFMDFKSLI